MSEQDHYTMNVYDVMGKLVATYHPGSTTEEIRYTAEEVEKLLGFPFGKSLSLAIASAGIAVFLFSNLNLETLTSFIDKRSDVYKFRHPTILYRWP